jgi:hypothetical protein
VICLFVRRQEEWPRRLCQLQREDKLLYGILSVVCSCVLAIRLNRLKFNVSLRLTRTSHPEFTSRLHFTTTDRTASVSQLLGFIPLECSSIRL